MENASKAVMIAGGVLIAIIIISVGMYIWGIGTGAFASIEQKKAAALREEEMVKFSQYVGMLYGSEVENCIRKITDFNELNGTNIEVYISVDGDVEFNGNKNYAQWNKLFDANNASKYVLPQTYRNDQYKGQLEVDNNGNLTKIHFVVDKKSDES